MPWNGAGNFSRTNGVNTGTEVWQDDAATVQNILSDRHDTHDQDIADGLNIALTKDGQSWPPTANLDMGTFKFTDVGDATARNQYLSLGQYQDGKHVWAGTAGGTADAITLAPSPSIGGYTAGMVLRFTVASDNTGAVTVNVNSQGARDLTDLFGAPLKAGSLKAGMTIEILDDGTEFRFNGERKIIVAQGDLIVGDPNGDPTALAIGTEGQVPTSDGTKLVYQDTALPRGYIDGQVLSNNSTDATNDIDVSPGSSRDDANSYNLDLASTITKRLDAAWSVGNNQGGLDTGSKAADTWYHVWAIARSDTGVVDVLFSTSATSPTLPTNYDKKRRIGAVLTDSGSAILAFIQVNDNFLWKSPPNDLNSVTIGTTASLRTITTPLGVRVTVYYNMVIEAGTSGSFIYVSSPDQNDDTPNQPAGLVTERKTSGSSAVAGNNTIFTDLSSQVRLRGNTGTSEVSWATVGWVDPRGRDG